MLIIVNHKGGIRIGSSGLRVICSGNIIGIKRQCCIPLRINRDRLAGLLESQTRFIRILISTATRLAVLASFSASKPLLLPSALPENVIDAAPGGQPVSFSVNGMGCVRLPVVLSCFVGRCPA